MAPPPSTCRRMRRPIRRNAPTGCHRQRASRSRCMCALTGRKHASWMARGCRRRSSRCNEKSPPSGGLSLSSDTAAQSYPHTLSLADFALPRIWYWMVIDVRRDLIPGAFIGAVCPPPLMTPTYIIVASGRLSQCRASDVTFTSAPSTESFTCLMFLFHISPLLVISVLGSAAFSVFSLSTNHWSPALALPMKAAALTKNEAIKVRMFVFMDVSWLRWLPLASQRHGPHVPMYIHHGVNARSYRTRRRLNRGLRIRRRSPRSTRGRLHQPGSVGACSARVGEAANPAYGPIPFPRR